jgi:hypothetical protein
LGQIDGGRRRVYCMRGEKEKNNGVRERERERAKRKEEGMKIAEI